MTNRKNGRAKSTGQNTPPAPTKQAETKPDTETPMESKTGDTNKQTTDENATTDISQESQKAVTDAAALNNQTEGEQKEDTGDAAGEGEDSKEGDTDTGSEGAGAEEKFVVRPEVTDLQDVVKMPFTPSPYTAADLEDAEPQEDPAALYSNIAPFSPVISARLFDAFTNLIAVNTTAPTLKAAQRTIHAEVLRVILEQPQENINLFLKNLLAVVAENLSGAFSIRGRMRQANDAFTAIERQEFTALINLFCDVAQEDKRALNLSKFSWDTFAYALIPERREVIINKLRVAFGLIN